MPITFHKIRQRLLNEKQLKRYFIYAIGEIFLIVLGILIAIQINNWNESQNEIQDFRKIFNEIESNILLDAIELDNDCRAIELQIKQLERLIYENPSLSQDSLQIYFSNILFYRWPDFRLTGYLQLQNTKSIKSISPILLRSINEYYTWVDYLKGINESRWIQPSKDFEMILKSYGLPPPQVIWSELDFSNFKLVLKHKEFETSLKYLLDSKVFQLSHWNATRDKLIGINSLFKNKDHNYNTVSLIGTATGKGWNYDIEMKQTKEFLWEIEMNLTAGEVKFRANNNWSFNWGSSEFPEGTGIQDGVNIFVKNGSYKVTLNTYSGKYHFNIIN